MATENIHTISVLVENEFGVLARISSMFAARGFNIDALSVAPTTDPKLSRLTLITHGDEKIIEQISKQLNRLIDVLKVVDLSSEESIQRELMLVKLRISEKHHGKALDRINQLSGKLIDEEDKKFLIAEFTQPHEKLEWILSQLNEFDIVETVRSGNIAIQKGKRLLSP